VEQIFLKAIDIQRYIINRAEDLILKMKEPPDQWRLQKFLKFMTFRKKVSFCRNGEKKCAGYLKKHRENYF